MAIDPSNLFAVAANSEGIVMLRGPSQGRALSHREAVNLAAWLLAMAYEVPQAEKDETIAAVLNS